MAFDLFFLWVCSNWTGRVYHLPVKKWASWSDWQGGTTAPILLWIKISFVSQLDRWRLHCFSNGLDQLIVLPWQIACSLTMIFLYYRPGQPVCTRWTDTITYDTLLLWTMRSAACPTWTDGVYSDPPVDQVSCSSYLDRWCLLWSSCGPDQLLVLPGQMAFNLILLWTRTVGCPTWTDSVNSDPAVDQISCLSYLDRWRLLWFSCGPDQLLVLHGQMAFTLILLWTRSDCLSYLDRWRLLWSSCGPGQTACPTWTDGVYSDSPVD